MDEDPKTRRQREIWDRGAEGYDRSLAPVERGFLGDSRAWIGSRAHGRVLEVAIGTGRSLPFYPAGTEIVGVDLSPAMLEVTRRKSAELGIPVDLHEGDAEHLPFADASFDTVVSELALCSIPRPAAAVVEMARVLRPGGTLLLLDHIGSSWPPIWGIQWLVERVTIPLAGEHFTRRSRPLVGAAGLEIVESERIRVGAVERLRATKA